MEKKVFETKELNYFNMQFSKMEVKEDKIVLEWLASTPDLDKWLDIVRPEAFKSSLEEYMKNPQILLQHKIDKPIWLCETAEIVLEWLKVRVNILNNTDNCFEMIRNKTLSWFSIWYYVKEAIFYEKEVDWCMCTIREITDLELVEISVVNLPMNPNATFTLTKSIEAFFKKNMEIKWEETKETEKVEEKKEDKSVNIVINIENEENENCDNYGEDWEDWGEWEMETDWCWKKPKAMSENEPEMVDSETSMAIMVEMHKFISENDIDLKTFLADLLELKNSKKDKEEKMLSVENKIDELEKMYTKSILEAKESIEKSLIDMDKKISDIESDVLSIDIKTWKKVSYDDPYILLSKFKKLWKK